MRTRASIAEYKPFRDDHGIAFYQTVRCMGIAVPTFTAVNANTSSC